MALNPQRPPRLVALYEEYLGTQDSARFIRDVGEVYGSATLERLARSGSRVTRRAAVLALGYLGDYDVNPVLGKALTDLDRGVRLLAENGIRSIWERAGNSYQRAQLQIVVSLVAAQRFNEAIRRATELIEQAPWFAEAWNQRAIAYYRTDQLVESIRDCRQALEINPYHFGAAAGIGYCHLEMKNSVAALDAFRLALRLNPNLENVRMQVIRLQKSLKDR